jgi:hypothetical protein
MRAAGARLADGGAGSRSLRLNVCWTQLMLAPEHADISEVTSITPLLPVSRAVERFIEPGSDAVCERCGEQLKFVARAKGRQVIANVYVDARWDRVEHYHDHCYQEAGEPYGEARAS